MNADAVRQFLCLAEHGNYAEAAQALGTTPATMSVEVRALENSLGVLLVAHDGNQVRLTRAGERLRSLAGPYLESGQRLSEQVREVGVAFLRLSAADGINRTEVSAQLKARDDSGAEPLVFTLTRTSLAQQRAGLRRASVDVGLSQTAAWPEDAGLAVEAAWREPLTAVLFETHPLSKHRTLTPAMLRTQPLGVVGQGGYDKQIVGLLGGTGDLPPGLQTRKTLGEVLLDVLDGRWVGLVGAQQWRAVQAMRGVTSRRVVDAQTGEPLWLTTYLRYAQTVTPALEKALAQLRKQLARVGVRGIQE